MLPLTAVFYLKCIVAKEFFVVLVFATLSYLSFSLIKPNFLELNSSVAVLSFFERALASLTFLYLSRFLFRTFLWCRPLRLVFVTIVSTIFYFRGWYNSFLRGLLHFFGFFRFFVSSIYFMVDCSNYYFLILG